MGIGTTLKNWGKQLDPTSWKSDDWTKAGLATAAVGLAYANSGNTGDNTWAETFDMRDPGTTGNVFTGETKLTGEAYATDLGVDPKSSAFNGIKNMNEPLTNTQVTGIQSNLANQTANKQLGLKYGLSPTQLAGLSTSDRIAMVNNNSSMTANPWVNAGAILGSAQIQSEATQNAQSQLLAEADKREKEKNRKLAMSQSAFTGGF